MGVISSFPTSPATATPNIYGVVWDGSASTLLTRTDQSADFSNPVAYATDVSEYGSPFDGIMPWAGMVRKTIPVAGEMVVIPKFWYELKQFNSTGISIRIADKPVEGFAVSPAHMDRNDGFGERDAIYVGRYLCNDRFRSLSGQTPCSTYKRASCRTNIHLVGTNVWQWDYAALFTIQLLYLVEFANWNSQETLGLGGGRQSPRFTTGRTDELPYHTGTSGPSGANSRLWPIQYRYIESMWDNIGSWVDGCYNDSDGFHIILNPWNSFYSEIAGNVPQGLLVGMPSTGETASCPTALSISGTGGFNVFYPVAGGGEDDSYCCDIYRFSADSYEIMSGGGNLTGRASTGLFNTNCMRTGQTVRGVGTRLMVLPPI